MSNDKQNSLYNNQIDARTLIGQLAIVYCACKLIEKSRFFRNKNRVSSGQKFEFFPCSTKIPRSLSAYKP